MEKINITTTVTSLSGASFFAYLGLNQESFFLLLIMIFIDFLTGLMKGQKNKNIQSDKMKNGLLGKIAIMFIPLSIAIVGKINGLDMSGFLAFSFALLSFAELYSTTANIYQVITGEKITEYDAVTYVIKIILEKIKNILNKLTNTK